MKAKLSLLMVALAVGALAVAGCGSDNSSNSNNSSSDTGASAPPPSSTESTPSTDTGSSGSGGAATALTLAADKTALKFDKNKLAAKAGKVTITMDNPATVPHAIAVEGNGVDKDGQTVTAGGKSTVTVDLKPGTYEFYCPVDGHKQAGMKGELTVK